MSISLIGFLLMLLGGSFLGSFSFQVKCNKKWSWENTWAGGFHISHKILKNS
jgi:hypothetical protein